MSDPASPAQTPPWQRLRQLLRPDRGDLIAVLLYAVAMGILLLATPVAVQALVNFVAQGGAVAPLIVVAALLFLGLAFAGGLAAVQRWVVEILQRRLFARTVADLAARLPRVAIEVHDRSYGPELVNRFFDVVTIQKTGAGLLLDGLSLLLSVLVGLVMLAFYHPLLLAFDILLLALIAVIVFAPLRAGVRTAIAESKAKYQVAGWLEELARHPHLFRSGGVGPWILQASDDAVREYLDQRGRHYRVLFSQIIGAIALHTVASTALLGIGGVLVMQGSLTLGQLVAAELIVTLIVSSVSKMGKHLEAYYDLMAATDKVGHLLDLPVEDGGREEHAELGSKRGASVELVDVTCTSQGASSLRSPLDLAIPAGARVAVTGPNGSGRSTLLDLLWGLRRPTTGHVSVEGRDLRELSMETLRRTACLVSEIEVLSGSILENVRIGRPNVSSDQVRDALRRTGILDEVERLPEGMSTELTPSGRKLSKEALRCLQIARAIVGAPRVLIVTEALLQLSGERRERTLETLFAPDAGWTLILSTDDEDLLARCDRVIELPGRALPRPEPAVAELCE